MEDAQGGSYGPAPEERQGEKAIPSLLLHPETPQTGNPGFPDPADHVPEPLEPPPARDGDRNDAALGPDGNFALVHVGEDMQERLPREMMEELEQHGRRRRDGSGIGDGLGLGRIEDDCLLSCDGGTGDHGSLEPGDRNDFVDSIDGNVELIDVGRRVKDRQETPLRKTMEELEQDGRWNGNGSKDRLGLGQVEHDASLPGDRGISEQNDAVARTEPAMASEECNIGGKFATVLEGNNIDGNISMTSEDHNIDSDMAMASEDCNISRNIAMASEECNSDRNIARVSKECNIDRNIAVASEECDSDRNIATVWEDCNIDPNVAIASEDCNIDGNIAMASEECNMDRNIAMVSEEWNSDENIAFIDVVRSAEDKHERVLKENMEESDKHHGLGQIEDNASLLCDSRLEEKEVKNNRGSPVVELRRSSRWEPENETKGHGSDCTNKREKHTLENDNFGQQRERRSGWDNRDIELHEYRSGWDDRDNQRRDRWSGWDVRDDQRRDRRSGWDDKGDLDIERSGIVRDTKADVRSPLNSRLYDDSPSHGTNVASQHGSTTRVTNVEMSESADTVSCRGGSNFQSTIEDNPSSALDKDSTEMAVQLPTHGPGKIDEYGRIAQVSSPSDSDAGGLRSARKRRRSYSRSISPEGRWRSPSRSPTRRRRRSRSHSQSPRWTRSRSLSPPWDTRLGGGRGRGREDWDSHGRGRRGGRGPIQEPCIYYMRGRCNRASFCRFSHSRNQPSSGPDAGRWSSRGRGGWREPDHYEAQSNSLKDLNAEDSNFKHWEMNNSQERPEKRLLSPAVSNKGQQEDLGKVENSLTHVGKDIAATELSLQDNSNVNMDMEVDDTVQNMYVKQASQSNGGGTLIPSQREKWEAALPYQRAPLERQHIAEQKQPWIFQPAHEARNPAFSPRRMQEFGRLPVSSGIPLSSSHLQYAATPHNIPSSNNMVSARPGGIPPFPGQSPARNPPLQVRNPPPHFPSGNPAMNPPLLVRSNLPQQGNFNVPNRANAWPSPWAAVPPPPLPDHMKQPGFPPMNQQDHFSLPQNNFSMQPPRMTPTFSPSQMPMFVNPGALQQPMQLNPSRPPSEWGPNMSSFIRPPQMVSTNAPTPLVGIPLFIPNSQSSHMLATPNPGPPPPMFQYPVSSMPTGSGLQSAAPQNPFAGQLAMPSYAASGMNPGSFFPGNQIGAQDPSLIRPAIHESAHPMALESDRVKTLGALAGSLLLSVPSLSNLGHMGAGYNIMPSNAQGVASNNSLEDASNASNAVSSLPGSHGVSENIVIVKEQSLNQSDMGSTPQLSVVALEPVIVASAPEGEKRSSQEEDEDAHNMKLLRSAVADFVKEVLKPSWRDGQISKEAFKTIAKKAVDKVASAMQGHQIPKTQEKLDNFMASSQTKISKLVQGYVDKYTKT